MVPTPGQAGPARSGVARRYPRFTEGVERPASRQRLDPGTAGPGEASTGGNSAGNPSPVPRSNPPLHYSTISTTDVSHFLSLTSEQLTSLYHTVPPSVQQKFPLNISNPLESILRIRDESRQRTNRQRSDADHERDFEKIMEMTPIELQNLSESNPAHLESLIHSARHARDNLPILTGGNSERAAMANLSTALAWKVNAVNDLLVLQEEKCDNLQSKLDNNNPTSVHPTYAPNYTNGTLPIRIDENTPSIGAVPLSATPAQQLEGMDFQGGRKSAVRLPSQIPFYPTHGTTPVSLAVTEILGPSILYNFIKHGQTVETYVRSRPYWQNQQHPEQIELEALTHARAIHLTLMQYPSPSAAILACPWMEVVLRRLYTLLKVEETHAKYPHLSRTTIWEGYKPALESQRDDGLIVPVLENTRIQHIAAETRTNAAMLRMNPGSRMTSAPQGRQRRRINRRNGEERTAEDLRPEGGHQNR